MRVEFDQVRTETTAIRLVKAARPQEASVETLGPTVQTDPTGREAFRRHEVLWKRDLAYEIRVLKLMTRCAREEDNRILYGDKSGSICCLRLDGGLAWRSEASGREIEGARGPIYDLTFVHPLDNGDDLLDLERHFPMVVAGTARGELIFLDYGTGKPACVDFGNGPEERLALESSILSLLYVESISELWAALADGRIVRLKFRFTEGVCASRSVIDGPREAVSSLVFMPRSRSRSGPEYRKGWICAATMLGNLYRLDHLAVSPTSEPLLPSGARVPLRAGLSLSRVVAGYGFEHDVLAIASGGSVKYFVQAWPRDGESSFAPTVLDRPCADRVFCLQWADLNDGVWLVIGANDSCLHLYRLIDGKQASGTDRDLLNLFAGRQYSIKLDERVREVAVRDQTEETEGVYVYVALGNHQLQAIHLLPQERFADQVRGQFAGVGSLEELLDKFRRAPDDEVLRHNAIALLFKAGWLSEYLPTCLWDGAEARRLRLVVYHLLTGISVAACGEILFGIVEVANQWPSLRGTATELVRHISKFCIDGPSFSDKRRQLDRLAEFNEKNGGDYLFDAALYRSLLAERRYTEQEVFELPAQVQSLQCLDLVPSLGSRFLLATSYYSGQAWLLDREYQRWIELQARTSEGDRVEWLQQALVWTDEASSIHYAVFFYRDLGWTSCVLDEIWSTEGLGSHGGTVPANSAIPLPQPRRVEGWEERPFYIYSFHSLPNGLFAIGGRWATVSLLRISRGEEHNLRLQCPETAECAGPHAEGEAQTPYAPIKALAFRSLAGDSGELFAGCENGACYRIPFDGLHLGEPQTLWESSFPVRTVACVGSDGVLIGDASGLLLLLRSWPASPSAARQDRTIFVPAWEVQVHGAVTGVLGTTLRVPSISTDSEVSWESRPVFLASDATGVLHVLQLDKVLEHSYAIRLDGAEPPPIGQLVRVPPSPTETREKGEPTRVAVACLDRTIRVLTLSHRRESVQLLNRDLANATIAVLQKYQPDLLSEALAAAQEKLDDGLTSNKVLPEVVQLVSQAAATTLGGNGAAAGTTKEDIQGALEEVAWKLSSANVQSESLEVLSLRLRYDDPASFPELLEQLDALASRAIDTRDGKPPHLRLRYCLRFAFKSAALLLMDQEEPSSELRAQLARFVHFCHDLTQNWGPDSSLDNLRCKLAVVHMFCRFATGRMLDWLLGSQLAEELGEIKGRTMYEFFEDCLLNDPRLPVPYRTAQHIRRMVERDQSKALREPVIRFIVPLIIRRFRESRATRRGAWIGMEFYLCLHSIQRVYDHSQWAFVAELLRGECPLSLLGFLAERQRVFPPDDERCHEVVESLSRALTAPAGAPHANEPLRILFVRLTEVTDQFAKSAMVGAGVFDCVRFLTAIAIAFDSNSDPELRRRARDSVMTAAQEGAAIPRDTVRIDLLLDCARLLIRISLLTAREPFDEVRSLYKDLRSSFEVLDRELVREGEADSSQLHVLRKLFFLAAELSRRQAEIEFDFVAPMRFLQERSFAGDPGESASDEVKLAEELLRYTSFHSELSRCREALFLRRDPSGKAVVVERVGPEGDMEILRSRSQVRHYLDSILSPEAPRVIKEEAARLFEADSVPPDAMLPELVSMGEGMLGELIQIHREGRRYGFLFFAYDRAATPDPSKRALSRMVPQFLVGEFMRSVQTQRLLALTFHHVSAPVAAMRTMLKALTDGHISQGDQANYLETLWYLTEDFRLMVENHQNYVRMVRGIAPPINIQRFDIVAEAEFRRRIIQYKYKGSHQTLRWVSTPEPLMVLLDRMMVGDIIQNLLDNACKYSPARTEIRMDLRISKREVFIEVSDRGPGLPENVSASLFGEGVRGEDASASTRPGLGLGLFMVYRYAIWLNGDVWSESSPGGGTTFTVRLPKEMRL